MYVLVHQARIVRKVDNPIQWINYYPLDSAVDRFSLYVFVFPVGVPGELDPS